MKIAILSPFEESVPPTKYGGTELVVYNVIENLVKLGHDVTLISTGDSKTSAKLFPVFKQSIRKDPMLKQGPFRDSAKFMGIGKTVEYLSKHKFDVVHNNMGWRLLPFQHFIKAPVVTTMHGPLDVPYQEWVYMTYKNANYVSISMSQRKPLPKLNFVGNVYNGIEVDKFKYSEKTQDYFAFLGRMSPEKGPVQAIQIAKKAGVKLVMAAKVDAVDTKYFDEQVKPLIDGKQIKFIGEVDHTGKVKLLSSARALIAPIQWEEPFGLFFVEAMACGTPVIAMKRGSVPEIVMDGKTGFTCRNNDEAAKAISKLDTISRMACRKHAETKFSAKHMTLGYLDVYKKVIKKKSWFRI